MPIDSQTATRYPGGFQPILQSPYQSPYAMIGSGIPGALQTAQSVNDLNLNYVRGGQQTDPVYGMSQNLLDPNWAPRLYDVGEMSAEDAVSRGISGSNLAGFRGARMYSDQLTKDALTANQLLTGATQRLPTPFNVESQIISPYQQQQLQLQYAQLDQQAKLEANRLAQQLKIQGMNDQAAFARALLEVRNRGYGSGYHGGSGTGSSVSHPSGTFDPYNNGIAVFGGSGGGGVPSQNPYQFPTNAPSGYDFGGNSLEGGFGGYGAGTQQPFDWSADYGTGNNADNWWDQDIFGATGGAGTGVPDFFGDV